LAKSLGTVPQHQQKIILTGRKNYSKKVFRGVVSTSCGTMSRGGRPSFVQDLNASSLHQSCRHSNQRNALYLEDENVLQGLSFDSSDALLKLPY
jgi:hypothetical protein